MKKLKMFVAMMVATILFVPSIMAAEISASNDTELKNAFSTAVSGDTIKLTDNITHDGGSSTLRVSGGKNITLDMNGYNITTNTSTESNRSIVVYGGTLNITGEVTITHETHNAINVWGSETAADNFSILNVGSDVKLVGNTGIAIFEDSHNGYGVKVDFNGTIEAVDYGITIAGNIKHENGPVVNINDGADISVSGSDGIGIYGAGNGTWNIEEGTTISSEGTAIGIKSGTFNITGGEFYGNGEYVENPELYGNGINPSGSAIQIETNSGYYGHINLNIDGGDFYSKNGNAIVEYGSDDTTNVESIVITDGSFVPGEDKDDIVVSNGLGSKQETENIVSIEGGVFYGTVDESLISDDYVLVDFTAVVDGEYYDMTEIVGKIAIPKGSKLDDDDKEFMVNTIGEDFEGYTFDNFYTDRDLKNVLDLDTSFDKNTTIYMNFVTKKVDNSKTTENKKVDNSKTTENKSVDNPNTGDINLLLIFISILLGGVGILFTRKQFVKNN